MGLKKLSEETVSPDFTNDSHLLVAQTEQVNGNDVNTVRRIPLFGESWPIQRLTAELTDVNPNTHLFDSDVMDWTFSDGVATFTPKGNEDPLEIYNHCNLIGSKHMVGFKYKLTKLESSADLPTMVVSFQNADGTDTDDKYPVVSWGNWESVSAVTEVDLKYIRIFLDSYSARTDVDFKIEIKELYIYNVTNTDPELYDTIKADQYMDYKSGTVIYGINKLDTDTELVEAGKAADAKAVGEALSNLQEITITDPNDDGNIVIELS